MAPIKFEEHIKEELEKTTIQPGSKSWDILSGQLDSLDSKKNNTKFWWLAIAASFIGILFSVSLFLKGDKIINDTPIVLETEIDSVFQLEKTPISPVENKTVILETVSVKEKPVKKERRTNFTKVKQQNIQESIDISPKVNLEVKVVLDDVLKPVGLKTDSKQLVIIDSTIKKQSIVTGVTDTELDKLLNNAKTDNKSLNQESSATYVDANELLQDVETDLEQTFRDKMFNTIEKGYQTLKTTVANRNE